MVETDAPYMAPVPMRGKRNDSRYLPYVIEKLAEWKGVTAEEMTRVTWENGRAAVPDLRQNHSRTHLDAGAFLMYAAEWISR